MMFVVYPLVFERKQGQKYVHFILFVTFENLRLEIKMDVPKKTNRKKPPQPGHEKRIKRTDAFLKRQSECNQLTTVLHFLTKIISVDKTWLETHLWHAKRMHMENMWGYRLVRCTL